MWLAFVIICHDDGKLWQYEAKGGGQRAVQQWIVEIKREALTVLPGSNIVDEKVHPQNITTPFSLQVRVTCPTRDTIFVVLADKRPIGAEWDIVTILRRLFCERYSISSHTEPKISTQKLLLHRVWYIVGFIEAKPVQFVS